MTTVGADGSGYFSDPYPVRFAAGDGRQVFTGTTKAVLACTYPLSPGCFTSTPLTVGVGSLGAQITAAMATVTNFQNVDAFQDDAGTWHAVLAIGVKNAAHPDHWTVLVHAHAASAPAPGATPIAWAADAVLSGSFSDPAEGNYDGKYFLDGGQLYLLYVRNFAPKPALRNGIVIQPMLTPTRSAAVEPTTLLTTGDRFGPLLSEDYGTTAAKLVEAPYLVRIADKYALLYSTGACQQVGYKAGVAWSDALLPPSGGRYRKVLEADVQGVWGQAGAREVRYLVQSQFPTWPGYTGERVVSPGVASMTRGPHGAWRLFFAGFDPADRPMVAPGVAEADHRRPFYLGLRVSVPAGRPVSKASDAELATWISPAIP
ncbi:family 43 glycosylhydrolase [Lichenibacterium dinghuense]|uniref:family 43 glycosylhydrolase n=1 Tax=Lichenibacterium dinghuense TaxID=2895977 RepID=UPI001F025B0B|nr:family 43 glycosylhydrolase [Lichenibacterium sp. 6Y81]